MNLFRLIPGYSEYACEAGKEPPLLLRLIAFLVAFPLTRAYTASLACAAGSTHIGYVHMHHVVVGIVHMTAAGVIAES